MCVTGRQDSVCHPPSGQGAWEGRVCAGWGGVGASRPRRPACSRPDFPSPPRALSLFPGHVLRPPSLVALESSAFEF